MYTSPIGPIVFIQSICNRIIEALEAGDSMKSTKVMLSAVMLMLLAIFVALVDIGRNTWLGGVSLILVLSAIIVFAVGLFINK